MPRGRPTDYSVDHCGEAEEFLAKGHSIHGCAGHLGIGRATIYRWMDEHEEFRDSIRRGVSKGLLFFEQRLLYMASGSTKKIDNFDAKKVDWRAIQLVLQTRYHREYGNKQEENKTDASNQVTFVTKCELT